MTWLDDYERRARLAPGLLTLLPLVILALSLGIRDRPLVTGALTTLAAAGGPVLIAQTVRHRGLVLQRSLWAAWGGSPTTESLRHVSPTATATNREHWRHEVERVTGVPLPTSHEEHVSPGQSDERYAVAVSRLIELTRDQGTFPLVYAENKNYGFERNMLGMQKPGFIVATASSLVLVGLVLWRTVGESTREWTDVLIGSVLSFTLVFIWMFIPNEDRVRLAGERYAARLLDSTTRLGDWTNGAS